jgi:ABC-type transport system involved in multi-copper enzyme maturation permease subunit
VVGSLEHGKGFYVIGVPALTSVRVIVGTAALLAVAAVFAVAVGCIVRRSAAAVAVVILAVVLPYILAVASVLPTGPAEWLTRLTPAAAFAIQQTVTKYPQVTASYAPADGYFPLPPLGGFAVLCVYAAAALGLAGYLLRRRDA